MKIYRAFAAAFVALFLLSACNDDPVADARAAVDRAHIAVLRASVAYKYAEDNKIAVPAEIREQVVVFTRQAFLAAYKKAQAAATAPTKQAAKQRAADANEAAEIAEAIAHAVETATSSVFPGYSSDEGVAYLMEDPKISDIDKYAASAASFLKLLQEYGDN